MIPDRLEDHQEPIENDPFPIANMDSPVDAKFGRASNYARPLDPLEIVGLLVAAVFVVVFLNFGAIVVAMIFLARHLVDTTRWITKKILAFFGVSSLLFSSGSIKTVQLTVVLLSNLVIDKWGSTV